MRSRAVAPLAALGVVASAMVAVPGTASAETTDSPQQLVVDFGDRTGPVLHGGHGALYALSDEGVPSDNTLEPLKMRTIAQKAPDGLQHPNGDALVVSDLFLRNGGEYIQIYMQDVYPTWPYDDLGFEDYLDKVDVMLEKITEHPNSEHFVYVPFNEPDWIWYGLNTGDQDQYEVNRDRFLADWKTVYERIRAADPDARIAGPNEAYYDRRFLPDFLEWTKANDVLPDIMTWHQLPAETLPEYRDDYAHYRALEQELGIDPLPININEWGGNRDLTVPGQMVQWVTMFEDTKVDAGGQAYWNAAGNLAGNVVQTNMVGGSWWFLKMYADMTGETVRVDPPQPSVIDTLQGMASIDEDKRQAHVVLGGTDGDVDVVLEDLDADIFGDSLNVTVASTTWSGQDAAAGPPVVLRDEDVAFPDDGSLVVPLSDLDPMAAYEIVLSPGGAGSRADIDLPWTASYEAEDAEIVSGTVYTQGTVDQWNRHAASGTMDVGSLNQEDSSVTFDVEVPEDGTYRLGILYGNQTGTIAEQVLTVDGEDPQVIDYEATMTWSYRARRDVLVELDAGDHTITLAKSHPDLGTVTGEATLDRIDLELLPGDGVEEPHVYEAERGQPTGDVAYAYDGQGQSGAGYVEIADGSDTMIVVNAEANGYYDLIFRHSGGAAQVTLGREDVAGAVLAATDDDGWVVTRERLFLDAGVNRVAVRATGDTPVALDAVAVARATSGPRPVQEIEAEAEDNVLMGAVRVEENEHASGGEAVGWIGDGEENVFVLNVEAPVAGDYVLVVHYANDERETGHAYNADIISRPADIAVNGEDAQRVFFRNTWSWDNFWALGVPVTLEEGENSISFTNDTGLWSGFAPNLDRFELAQLRVQLPEEPTTEPTTEPTEEPTTEPTEEPTTEEPTTDQPTEEPTTEEPTTDQPTEEPTTEEPTSAEPTVAPTTDGPTVSPTAGPGGDGLPSTGTDLTLVALSTLALLALGGVLVARRKVTG